MIEHAAVGDQLDRRAIEPGARVVGQLELLERQFAAHHHGGPLAVDPSLVVADLRRRGRRPTGSVGQRLVGDRVVDLNQAAVHIERVRDPHRAGQDVADALRDDGLAVAGRAVDEERVARVDRRARADR